MSAAGRHFLNGVDVWENYGLIVSFGSALFLSMPKRKEPLVNDWPDENGREYDLLAPPKFEEEQASLQCAIIAHDLTDFHAKRTAFYANLCQPGWQSWGVTDLDITKLVQYKQETGQRKENKSFSSAQGDIAFSFTLVLAVSVNEDDTVGVVVAPLRLNTAQRNVSTYGGADGQITLTGLGGSGSYQYRIGTEAWRAAQAGPLVFNGLTAGNHTGSVRDANDNAKMATKTITLTQPAPAPTYNTTLTTGQQAIGITLQALEGVQFLFNAPQPSGTPAPATMSLYAGSTQIGEVYFNTPYLGQPCGISYNGVLYHKNFVSGSLNILS